MSANWLGMEQALARIVKAALGFTDEQVRWVRQNLSEPAAHVRTWVSLRRGDLLPMSGVDGVCIYPNPTPAPGQEIILQAQALLTTSVFVRCMSRDATVGNGEAQAVLSTLSRKLALPTAQAALRTAGIGLNRTGRIQDLSMIDSTLFQGEAELELALNFVDTAEEFATVIQALGPDATLTTTTPSVISPLGPQPSP